MPILNTHRTFAYMYGWQMASRRPQREMWSGTSGAPTAPKLGVSV